MNKLTKTISTLSILAASAVTSFAALVPGEALSQIFTIARLGCRHTNSTDDTYDGTWSCSVQTSDALRTSNLAGAYFDFYTYDTQGVTTTIRRESFNGATVSFDQAVTSGSGYHDVWVGAVNTKTSPSSWDYLSVFVSGFHYYFIGAAVTTN